MPSKGRSCSSFCSVLKKPKRTEVSSPLLLTSGLFPKAKYARKRIAEVSRRRSVFRG